jgi:site-specific recombinase XerD
MLLTGMTATTSLADALHLYETEFLAARNLAVRSRREYLNDLKDLLVYLTSVAGVSDPAQVSRRHLEGYLAELDRRGFSGSTRRRKVASIRSFFGFLQDAGMIQVSPALKLIPPDRERMEPRVLSEGEYKRLLEAVRGDIRDQAIIELLLQTGLRLSEVSRLHVNHVSLPTKISKEPGFVGSVTVLGKGRKQRSVTLNYKACRAIKNYLSVRPAADDTHLFLTKFKKGIGPRGIEKLVEKYLKEAGIPNASVHTLRHTFATHTIKKGTKLEVVRQALGHESLETTSIYVHLAREMMDKELQENAL